jgi:diguanylate cyclase (GGDEF)-like protein
MSFVTAFLRPRFRPTPASPLRLILPLVLLFVLLALQTLAGAATPDERTLPVQLQRVAGGLPIVGRLQLFEDTTRALDIAQVRTAQQDARFAFPDDPLTGKESDRVLWFKATLQLADARDTRREWLLVVPTVSTLELRFHGPYGPDGRAIAAPVVTGMHHPWSTRPAASEQMAWRFTLPDTQPYTVYFRVDSIFARVYDVRAWDAADYLESTQDKRMFDGVSYGILLGLMVYSLVLLIVFGEAIYIYYMLSCVCALLAIAGFNGHTIRYPFARWPAAAWFFYTLAPALWTICKLQFGRQVLRLRHFAPRLDRVVQGMLVALAAATVYALVGAHPLWMFRMVQAAVIVSTVVLLGGALVAVRRRYWPAVLYCIGIALLLAGISAIIVASWGWVTWTPSQMNVTQAALVAEIVVFAVAMASRLSLMRRSEQRLSQRTQELVEALGTDSLTGAASRSGLTSRAAEWLAAGHPFALMVVDLDGFKAVNDQHGHAAGDAVLVATAQRLRQLSAPQDIVARLGGDEFAILVAGSQERSTLSALAERLATECRQPIDFEGRPVAVGMSIGIARHPRDGDTLASLLHAADMAMYHRKQQRGEAGHAFAEDLPRGGA